MLALTGVFVSSAARADLFSNIQLWAGTGTNEAGFEIDWNNGATNSALLWGYRWNGTATGEQMFDAIVATDPRLYAEVSGPTDYGTEVFGLGFHQSGDQNFSLSPSLSFNSQHLAIVDAGSVEDSRAAVTSGDLWQEGWYTAGYWTYWNSTDSRVSANQSDWDSSYGGMTSRVLENGDMDGWSFDYGFNWPASTPAAPSYVTAVPEPSAWALLGMGGLFMVCLQINRRSNGLTGTTSPVVITRSSKGSAIL